QVDVDRGMDVRSRKWIHSVAIIHRHPYTARKPPLEPAPGDAFQPFIVTSFKTDRTAVAKHVAYRSRGETAERPDPYGPLFGDQAALEPAQPEQRELAQYLHLIVIGAPLEQMISIATMPRIGEIAFVFGRRAIAEELRKM